MSQFYNVKTNAGDAAIANAIATNTKLNITHVAFGDGNGAVPTPDKLRTTLVHEVHRQAVTKYTKHPTVSKWITVETIIPAATGGFWIREIGIIADGVMITHGSHAPFFKVADTEGVSEYRLKFTIDIQDASIVQLVLDQSLIFATQAWINTNYIPRADLIDNLTTDDATKPLSAQQGKNLQDNKLEKTDNAVSATKLKNARTIGGVPFDGSENINLPGVNTKGNQDTSGNAETATKLAVARKIGGVPFDGSADIDLFLDAVMFSPIAYPSTTVPNGYLAMMGQQISQAQYPNLYALYGAALPDMRGEFIRGWDNGRGVDSGRSILSGQGDYAGGLGFSNGNLMVTTGPSGTPITDWFRIFGRYGSMIEINDANSGDVEIETHNRLRPRNIAFQYIVKAG